MPALDATGSASLDLPANLSVPDTRTVTAVYSGDTNFTASSTDYTRQPFHERDGNARRRAGVVGLRPVGDAEHDGEPGGPGDRDADRHGRFLRWHHAPRDRDPRRQRQRLAGDDLVATARDSITAVIAGRRQLRRERRPRC